MAQDKIDPEKFALAFVKSGSTDVEAFLNAYKAAYHKAETENAKIDKEERAEKAKLFENTGY